MMLVWDEAGYRGRDENSGGGGRAESELDTFPQLFTASRVLGP